MEKKRLLAGLLAGVIFTTPIIGLAEDIIENQPGGVGASAEVTELTNELEQIEAREAEKASTNELIQNQRTRLNLENQSLEESLTSLDKLEAERAELSAEIDQLQSEIDQLNDSIAKQEAEKVILEEDLAQQKETFEKRLGVMYKNRNTGMIDLLLSAENTSEFLSKYSSMKSVASYDKELIEKLERTNKELEKLIISLRGQKASRDEAMTSLNVKQAELVDAIYDERDLIAHIQVQMEETNRSIQGLEDRVASLNEEIEGLNIQYQERLAREEAERKRKEEEERQRLEAEARARAEAEAAAAAAQAEAAAREAANSQPVYEPSPVYTSSYDNYIPEANYTPFDGNIVYYSQREEPWASSKYGTGYYSTINANGCGPTSMAMVLSSMTDQNVTPINMAQYAMANGHCMPGDDGSYWTLFPAAAKDYGLACKQTTNQAEIINALSNGALVISSMNNALGNYWTYGGHFIVLTGVDDAGNVSVADPWSRGKSAVKHSQNYIFTPMKSAWIITGQ